MAQDPEQLKEQIAMQRAAVDRDLEAIGDKVLPGRVAERARTRVRRRLHDVRDRIMGTADDVTSSAGESVSSAGEAVTAAAQQVGQQLVAAPQAITRRTEGSPIAAGLVAFGAGVLLASLLPRSEAEQELAGQLAPGVDAAKGVAQGAAQQAAHHVVADLREPVQDAVQDVRDRATEAAGIVAEQAKGGADSVEAEVRS